MSSTHVAPLPNFPAISRGRLASLQVNLGYRCNQACTHCHVEAGPQRTEEMDPETIDLVLQFLADRAIQTLDVTGGAPELHPRFKELVLAARAQGCHVMDRCNLTVLLLPALRDLTAFLAEHQAEIVASLPQPEAESTDAQRGDGTWEASIEALKRLNQLGYGQGDPLRQLTLMSNPAGTRLQQLTPCDTAEWKRRLQELAFLNRGVKISLADARTGESDIFQYHRGIIEFGATGSYFSDNRLPK